MPPFLRNVLQHIGRILGFFGSTVTDFIQPAYGFVSALKSVIDNPALDFVVQLTATNIDDLVLAKIREFLPVVLKGLGISDKILTADTPEALVQNLADYLKKQTPAMQSAHYAKIASGLAVQLSNGDLREYEADTLVHTYHASIKTQEGLTA